MGVDDPWLAPGDVGEWHVGEGAAGAMEEAAAEAFGEGAFGNQEVLAAAAAYRAPGTAVGGEAAAGDEEVDVGMPLEGAGPGVQHGEGADASTEEPGIAGQGGEGFEGGVEKGIEEEALV